MLGNCITAQSNCVIYVCSPTQFYFMIDGFGEVVGN